MDNRDADAYPSLVHPLLASTNPTRSDASIAISHWQMSQHSPPNCSASSSSQPSAMFAVAGRSQGPQPAYLSAASYHPTHAQHATAASYEHERQKPSLDSPQVNGSIGPIRPQTQRGYRGGRPSLRWEGSPGLSSENANIRPVQAGDYVNYSRPHTPNNFPRSYQYPSAQSGRVTGPESMQQAWSTGAPVQTHITNYYHNQHTAHSRSDSTSTSNPRSASPALSVASAMTSQSSAGSAPNSQTFSTFPSAPTSGAMSPVIGRQKHRKQRLFNVDRRAICVYANQNPHLRQEDIAAQYGVERSTISKILKQKARWLNVPADEELKVAKHRPTKFPEIELELHDWLLDCKEDNIQLTDALIRNKAKEVARSMSITDDKFKASSGWVENFKHRHGIRKGIWHGNGRDWAIARALGIAGDGSHVEMDHRPFVDTTEDAEILRRAAETDRQTAAAAANTSTEDYGPESEDEEPAGPSSHHVDAQRHSEQPSPAPVQQPSPPPAQHESTSAVQQQVPPTAQHHSPPAVQHQSPTNMQPMWQPAPQPYPSPSAPTMQAPMHLEHSQSAAQVSAQYSPPASMPPTHHVPQNHHGLPEPPAQQAMIPHGPSGSYAPAYQNAVQPLPRPHMPVDLLDAHTAMTTVLRWAESQAANVITTDQRQTLTFVMRTLDRQVLVVPPFDRN
ncbi:hypothetical protein OE88DRAFT_1724991 [Heliocybe sulcata]|uniref:HTH CENPB-type domain-containing protein n=1 Tax=Heliocybe sulcata TaxID=5364 RepID=A0A5C3N8M1_9AGAM|nr:hypothetical protein OE88DRAFT_1724991 [Heliocybe sulcata]